jgi:hypothetical protein
VQARHAYEVGSKIFMWRHVEVEQKLGWLANGAYQNALRVQEHDAATTLEAIEEIGWRLDNVSREFTPRATKSRNKFWSTGQQAAIAGQSVAVYMFRRAAS